MKKTIIGILTVIVVLSMLSVSVLAAETWGSMSLSASKAEVAPGETVSVSLYLGDCAGLGVKNFKAVITVPEGLTIVDAAIHGSFSGATGMMAPSTAVKDQVVTVSSFGNPSGVYEGGKIEVAKIILKADEAGEYSIALSASLTDSAFASQNPAATGTKVSVVVPHVHTPVVDAAVAPTCTETGLTEGSHCSECGEVLVPQEVVAALGHTPAVDAAVAATCTETGLTEGSHCSVCNEVLVAQVVVPALGHDYKAVVTEPTCTKAGYTTYTCANCGDSYVADEVPALGHKYVWKFVDEENHQQICSVCGHKGQIAPHNFGDDTVCDDCGYDKGKDPVPPTGDITPVIVTTAFAVVAAIAAAAYMLKRKFNV